MDNLLNTSVDVRGSRNTFDGLGNLITSSPVLENLRGRMRLLSAGEQYLTQGSEAVANVRWLFMGSLKDHPGLKEKNYLTDKSGTTYRILTVEEARVEETPHHLQVDCIKVSGLSL